MRLIQTSPLSNQDISSALLVCTYTADAAREIFVRLFADQIAGNSDYVAYITIQRAGVGSAYQIVPITTAAVASGVAAIGLITISFPVTNTDVVKVYLTGAAGDTTTPDIITEIWESVESDLEDGGRLDVLIDSIITYAASSAAWGSINSGMVFRGVVSAANPGVSFTIGGLAGQGAGAFIDENTPWYAYVFRDAGGEGAAPQGETQQITGYTTASGLFTSNEFTEPVAVGDDVVIMSGRLATIPAILADTNELQGNQGDWATATGFATPNDVAQAHADTNSMLSSLSTLDAAGVRTAIGLASANLDTQIAAIPTTKTGYALSAAGNNAVADAYLDRTSGVETGVTPRQYMQRVGAVVAGKVSGARTGTEVFVGMDGVTERVTGTVDDSGNRTAVTYV
jgi:hypothetical protein